MAKKQASKGPVMSAEDWSAKAKKLSETIIEMRGNASEAFIISDTFGQYVSSWFIAVMRVKTPATPKDDGEFDDKPFKEAVKAFADALCKGSGKAGLANLFNDAFADTWKQYKSDCARAIREGYADKCVKISEVRAVAKEKREAKSRENGPTSVSVSSAHAHILMEAMTRLGEWVKGIKEAYPENPEQAKHLDAFGARIHTFMDEVDGSAKKQNVAARKQAA